MEASSSTSTTGVFDSEATESARMWETRPARGPFQALKPGRVLENGPVEIWFFVWSCGGAQGANTRGEKEVTVTRRHTIRFADRKMHSETYQNVAFLASLAYCTRNTAELNTNLHQFTPSISPARLRWPLAPLRTLKYACNEAKFMIIFCCFTIENTGTTAMYYNFPRTS